MSAVDLFESCFWESAASLSAVEDNYSMCVSAEGYTCRWVRAAICLPIPPTVPKIATPLLLHHQTITLELMFFNLQYLNCCCHLLHTTKTSPTLHPLQSVEKVLGCFLIFGCTLPSNLPGISETHTSASVNGSTLRCLCSSCWQRRRRWKRGSLLLYC